MAKHLRPLFVCTLWICVFALLPVHVHAQDAPYTPLQTRPADLGIVAEGKVSDVLKPDLLRLADGTVVLLDNIRVPLLYADATVDWIEANVVGKDVIAYANPTLGAAAHDRMGNRLVHLVLKDHAVWVQEQLVANGLAWADSTQTNRDMIIPLLATEDAARTAQKGFWTAPGMAPRKANNLGSDRDAFMIVEGTAINTANKGSYLFANFGPDWKTDFTLALSRDNAQNRFPDFLLNEFEGRRIRVRGWVSERNGPMIELTHPEQIEWLDKTPAAQPTP